MNWQDMDISNLTTQNVPTVKRQFQQRPQPAPYVIPLPAHRSQQEAERKGLRHWLRYQRRSWWLTVAFVAAIFLAEIAGLTLSLALHNSLPGQSQLFPKTFPTVSPTVPQCVHATLYFDANGQLQQTGIDETCR